MHFKRSRLRHGYGLRAGLLIGGMSLVLAACGSGAGSTTSSTTKASSSSGASKSPVTFHAVIAETGSASFLGSREEKALIALASYENDHGGINGHKIIMDIQDNQSDPATAVSIATPWVSQGVSFILNGSVVATDQAVDALATSNGPVIYDLSPGTHPAPKSYIFSSGLSTKFDIPALLNLFKTKGWTKIAFLNTTDASGTDGWTQMQAALAESQYKGLNVVSHQTYDPTSVSVTTQMSVIKAANPQALIIWTTGTPLGAALQAQSQLGMSSLPTATTAGNAVAGEMTHLGSVLPKQLYFPTGALYLPPADLPASVAPVVKTFQSLVAGAGGHPNDGWGLAYAPALMFISALQHLGVNATPAQLRTYLQDLHNYPDIYGVYNLSPTNHRGVSLSGIYDTMWTGTTFKPVTGPGGFGSKV